MPGSPQLPAVALHSGHDSYHEQRDTTEDVKGVSCNDISQSETPHIEESNA